MNPEPPESFVNADQAAKFLSLTRRRVLDLARARKLPGHPLGDGSRRVWRFRLSEVAAAVVSTQKFGFASRERAGMVRPQTISGPSEEDSDGAERMVNKTQNQTQRNDLGLSLLSRQARNRKES
jgi:hypothetical protein